MDTQDYLEITISIDPFSEELAEIIEAEISEYGFDAFMVEGDTLKAYIQSSLFDEIVLSDSLSSIEGCKISFTTSKMPQINWNSTWEQEGFTPIIVDDTITVRPDNGVSTCSTKFDILLEANMAFGTGHHHTTFMMMQTMLSIEDSIRNADVTDLGCGTGVLGILAGEMNAAHVEAIDIDAVAARSAQKNIERNKTEQNTTVLCGDASLLKENSIDVLIANIHRNIIINDLPLYSKAVKGNGFLLVSGFYDTDIKDIVDAAAKNGFFPAETNDLSWQKVREGWACLKLKKESNF